MKVALLSIWMCLSATAALAQVSANLSVGSDTNASVTVGPVGVSANVDTGLQAAPAPLIGFGIPAALAIGGVLLGGRLLQRKR
jgi:lipid-binding SYLF domain-containing protein